jgi:hypothetical protein
VISIFRQDQRLADVEMIDGRLHVVSYDGEWVERLILQELRPHVYTVDRSGTLRLAS